MKKVFLSATIFFMISYQASAQQFASPSSPDQLNPPTGTTETHSIESLVSNVMQGVDPSSVGISEDNPILPENAVTVTLPNGRTIQVYSIKVNFVTQFVVTWIDPVVAVGYNYFIDKGPNVISIELPDGIGDNKYDLWLYDSEIKDFKDSGIDIYGGKSYKFEKPLRQFSIRGIETSAELDPEDTTAFPSGLVFDASSRDVKIRMVALSVDTDKETSN